MYFNRKLKLELVLVRMAISFDQHDKESWYFGAMSRQEATDILLAEKEGGVFLVRDSTTIQGDYVLCVREDSKVSHYIINKIQQGEQTRYRIGDQMFTDLPALLNFYKVHYLDTTPLIRPAVKKVETVRAKFDFDGQDPDDLPFKKGETLTIISKDEEQWWTARNSLGQTGSVPVPYITVIEKSHPSMPPPPFHPQNGGTTAQQPPGGGGSNPTVTNHTISDTPKNKLVNVQRQLPAYARVKQARVPNAYDRTALRLEVGDIVTVTKMSINGQWEGELRGKVGHFPFTHVEFIDDDGVENS